MYTIRRVAVIEGDRASAEMLHTFFRLMEVECALVRPDPDAVPTLRRLHPDIVVLDLDLPHLRALEIAREIRDLPLVLLTDRGPQKAVLGAPVMRKPHDEFEELLRLFEVMLAM